MAVRQAYYRTGVLFLVSKILFDNSLIIYLLFDNRDPYIVVLNKVTYQID